MSPCSGKLITGEVDVFDDPDWPLLGATIDRPAARIHSSAEFVDSLVSPGCDIKGRVVRSVLGPGVIVEEGAEVVDSVRAEDVTVRTGAFVGTAIVDHRVEIGTAARIGVETGGRLPVEDDISLVGHDTIVNARTVIDGGTTTAGTAPAGVAPAFALSRGAAARISR